MPELDNELRADPTNPPPATEEAEPSPCPPPSAPPAEGDGKLGTFAGVVGCASVNGRLTGPLPITRAVTTDTAAAAALSDAMLRLRTSCCGRLGGLEAAASAVGTRGGATEGCRPKSGDAKTSSKVA